MSTPSDARITASLGTPIEEVLKVVREAHNGLGNLHSQSTAASDLPDNYLTWVHENVRMWRHRVVPADIDRLLRTPAYWAIQGAPGAASIKLTNTEIADRQVVLSEIVAWLGETIKKWERSAGRLVVADTSVYCHHEDLVENINFAGALGLGRHPIRLMVPILVLDELEGLKQSSKRQTRWRAAHTLGKLDEVLQSDGTGVLRAEDKSPIDRGELPEEPVYVEVFFDPAGHRRLPINDDELIDRALVIQAESGKEVTFLTFDTAQSTRAKFAGLAVKKLKEDAGPEPLPETN
jgi:PIN domain